VAVAVEFQGNWGTRLGGIQLASCQSKGAAGPITGLRGIKSTFSHDGTVSFTARPPTHSPPTLVERKNAELEALVLIKRKTPAESPVDRVTRVAAALLLMHFKLNRKTFPSCAQREPRRENKISLSLSPVCAEFSKGTLQSLVFALFMYTMLPCVPRK
jgi:hypothetical protein